MDQTFHELTRAFMCAVVEDHPAAALLLEQHPKLLNARWMHNETALHYLAIEGFNDAVQFLLAHGADVNTVNEFGDSPLSDMAVLGRDDIATILLNAGADPNGALIQDRERPIHAAARKGNVGLLKLLLDAGADARYVTHLRETIFDALDEAAPQDRDRILALLAERGIAAPLHPGDHGEACGGRS
jgi:ankyrin repeat protein